MITYFDNHFNRNVIIIYPGEFYVTRKDELISTVLGSCVTVALYDQKKKIGGINHFILAKDGGRGGDDSGLVGRFGDVALNLLLESMLKEGAEQKSICAKVFGGGNVLHFSKDMEKVGDCNIRCAFEFLERNKIPVLASDVGGVESRKIFFESSTAKVWLKRIENTVPEVQQIITVEKMYVESFGKEAACE